MDFKVIWSEEAIADLRNICSYVARHDPDAALRMGNGILDSEAGIGRMGRIVCSH